MECPCCGEGMEEGRIQVRMKLPGFRRKRITLRKGIVPSGIYPLSRFSFLKGSKLTAYLCRDCGKVIIPYFMLSNLPYQLSWRPDTAL